MRRIIVIDKKSGKKKLTNIPSHNIGINQVGWDSGGGYNDYAGYLGPRLYLDAGRNDSYYTGSLYVGTGNTWVDVSGNNFNGTLNNGVSYTSNYVGSLDFNRADGEWVNTADLGSMTNFTAVTFARFDVAPVLGVNALVTNRFTGVESYVNFAIGSFGLDNKIVGGFWTNVLGWKYPTGYTVSTGVWYMFAVTYDGATIRFYVNGVEYSNLAVSATVGTSGVGVSIAKRWDTSTIPSDFFDGLIPVVIVYNKAISASDITLVYNQFAPRYGLQ
jgi:hypothetical protein